MGVKEVVKEKYGEAALRVISGKGSACCGSSPSSCCSADVITGGLYDSLQKSELPEDGSAGISGMRKSDSPCRTEGRGDGVGSRQRRRYRRVAVGASGRSGGKAYGLDMTDEMLALARENQKKAEWKTSSF